MKKLYFSIAFILLLSINNYAQVPVLTIGDLTIDEGSGSATVPLTLSEISNINTVIDILTVTGTATNSDFTATNVTLIIPAGQTTTSVNIPITDDLIDEADETFTVEGTITSGNTVNNTAVGTVTIIDNDSTPYLFISNSSVSEGGTLVFDITLSNPSSGSISLTFGYTNITANDLDYDTAIITITIPAGATSSVLVVSTIDDNIVESDETFLVGITSFNGIVNGTSDTSLGTILDNDVLSANNFSFDNLEYYPNPVKNSFEIKNSSDIETVEIFSLNGQKIYENTINAIYTKIDTSNFAKGVYVLKIKALNEEKTIKLVKE